MGTGASADAEKAKVVSDVKAASEDEVKSFVAGLSEEQRTKLLSALDGKAAAPAAEAGGKPEWKECFIISGEYKCKDVALMATGALKDAQIQVKEEPRAPRMTIMGLTTNEPALEETKDKVFWLAEFECFEAWDGPDHKARETNKEFMKNHYMPAGASSDEGMPGLLKDMAGSFTGAALHLEKPGAASGESARFLCRTKVKAKDEATAGEVVELLRSLGAAQLEAEKGALGVTLYRAKDMGGPLPKDELEIGWLDLFASKEDFASHQEAAHVKECMSKLEGKLAAGPVVYEFADTKHFQK